MPDDRGLSKLVYTFSYYSEDSDFVRGLRTKFVNNALNTYSRITEIEAYTPGATPTPTRGSGRRRGGVPPRAPSRPPTGS